MAQVYAHEFQRVDRTDLDLTRQFIGLHDHRVGRSGDLPPSPETLRRFLTVQGLIADGVKLDDREIVELCELQDALRAKVRANQGARMPRDAVATIDRWAAAAHLRPRFSATGPPRLEPGARGLHGSIGWLLAAMFLAELDGRWSRLKECAGDDCRAVFADHSKNHSARWCSMERCGNRAKVRAWRERHGADVADA